MSYDQKSKQTNKQTNKKDRSFILIRFQNVSNFGFSDSGPGERFQGSVSVKVVPEKGFNVRFQ